MTPTTLTRTRPLKRKKSLGKSRRRIKIRVRKRDLAWAKAVKERDGYTCRRCGKNYGVGFAGTPIARGLHAAHIFGRSRRSTRFDLDNGICLCFGCHRVLHSFPLEMIALAKHELGEEKFEALRVRAMQTTKKVTV